MLDILYISAEPAVDKVLQPDPAYQQCEYSHEAPGQGKLCAGGMGSRGEDGYTTAGYCYTGWGLS